jgi:ribose 5-phosphate isomerase A
MASTGATGRRQPPLSGADPAAAQKRAAAVAAAELIEAGMRVGLGTGSTVAHLLPAIAARDLGGLRCVATSPATEHAARALGLTVETLDEVGELEIAIDGADQVDPAGWLVKGGGGAQVREKIVAAAARRYVVIVSADKPVAKLSPPVPLELLEFGLRSTLASLAPASLRDRAPASPDGGLIADYLGAIEDPAALAAWLSAVPGVIGHGLFEPAMVSDVLIGGDDGVRHVAGASSSSPRRRSA